MIKRARLILGFAAFWIVAACHPLGALTPVVRSEVNWPEFLAQHDLVWEQFPPTWNTGGFIGNGQLGCVVYTTLADNRVDFHLGRSDVTDHRKAPDRPTSFGVSGANSHYDFPRLDLGRMALRPAGKIKQGSLRLDLLQAELRGRVLTDLGEISFRAFIAHDPMVTVVEVVSTEKTPDGVAAAWRWEFLPGNPIAPRRLVMPNEPAGQSYQPNPPPLLTQNEGTDVCVQSLLAGGDYATAWTETPRVNNRSTLVVSVANEVPRSGESVRVATQAVRTAAVRSYDQIAQDHRKGWQAFYARSFLTIPNAKLESFYWIQLFKFASASRPNGPLVDCLGPFFRITQWPAAWWNLNVQLTYWLPLASNHLDLAEPLSRTLDTHFDAMLRTMSGPNIGDLAWALHNDWLFYRYAGDSRGLIKNWVPKAAQVVERYQRKLVKEADGKLHLLQTQSPEYPGPAGTKGFANFDDSNYNLALLRWMLNALIEADPASAQTPFRKQLLADLTPLVMGPDGLMIARNQPVAISHRHYSHLLALYPLFQLSPDDAVGMLTHFITAPKLGTSYLSQTTFYFETGGKNPVIETPLSAGAALIELLLQSWGGKLRPFAAVPQSWAEASFADLRGQGGFLVSAQRLAGKTSWVSVESLAGEPCVLKVDDWKTVVPVSRGQREFTVKTVAPGEFSIDLKQGERVILSASDQQGDFIVRSIPHPAAECNLFGVKAGDVVPLTHVWPEQMPATASP